MAAAYVRRCDPDDARYWVYAAWRDCDDAGPVPDWVEAAALRISGGRFVLETPNCTFAVEMGDWFVLLCDGSVRALPDEMFRREFTKSV